VYKCEAGTWVAEYGPPKMDMDPSLKKAPTMEKWGPLDLEIFHEPKNAQDQIDDLRNL
jgi:hypothetical protein